MVFGFIKPNFLRHRCTLCCFKLHLACTERRYLGYYHSCVNNGDKAGPWWRYFPFIQEHIKDKQRSHIKLICSLPTLSGKSSSSFLEERPGCWVKPGGMPASPEEFYSSLWDMATHSSWARHNSSSLLLPPWQGSLAVPETGTDSCEVSSAKARSINPLLITCLMGSVGLRKESVGSCELCRQGSSLQWNLCWAGFSANGGGKGSELGFLTGCILQVPLLHSCSLCCWPAENAAFSICVHVEQGQAARCCGPRERVSWSSPPLPVLKAQRYALQTIPLFSPVPWTEMSACCVLLLQHCLDLYP